MSWEKIEKFWKAGLAGTVILVMTGCGNGLPEVPDFRETVEDNEMYLASEDDFDDAENIAAVYRDIYESIINGKEKVVKDEETLLVMQIMEDGQVDLH